MDRNRLHESRDQRALCEAWFNPHLNDDDRAWVRKQLELCDQTIPEVDLSWITLEKG